MYAADRGSGSSGGARDDGHSLRVRALTVDRSLTERLAFCQGPLNARGPQDVADSLSRLRIL